MCAVSYNSVVGQIVLNFCLTLFFWCSESQLEFNELNMQTSAATLHTQALQKVCGHLLVEHLIVTVFLMRRRVGPKCGVSIAIHV